MNGFKDDGSFLEQMMAGKSDDPRGPRKGDWTCPSCKANVFASKDKCFKCGTAREQPDSKPQIPEPAVPSNDGLARRQRLEAEKRQAVDEARRLPEERPSFQAPTLQPVAAAPAVDPNQLAAKALRAKLVGNTKLHAELTEQAEQARAAVAKADAVVVLAQVDLTGEAIVDQNPTGATNRGHSFKRDQRPKRTQCYEKGERNKYFADDDNTSLADMVRGAKTDRRTPGIDDNFADNVIRAGSRYAGNNVDDEYDHDGGLQAYENRSKKWSQKKREDRHRESRINQTRQIQTIQDRCKLCFANCNQECVVSTGSKCYLALPSTGSIVAGHCWILPREHEMCSRMFDDDTWQEARNYKKCLLRAFAAQKQDCIFVETVPSFKGMKHGLIECIPVPWDRAKQAPAYFKQSLELTDATSEFETTHKRIIDTRQKGLLGSIPKHFPYFHVEFGIRGGYAHIIEDAGEWHGSEFAYDVCGTIMKLPKDALRPRRSTGEEMRLRREEFKKMYMQYDWTKMLQEDDQA